MVTSETKRKTERKRPSHRPMPEDPRQLAKAMFEAADKKSEEGRAAEKPATQER